MRVLGIETTCDETGVAVFEDGPRRARRAARQPGRDARGVRRRRARARLARPHRASCCRWSRRCSRRPSLELSRPRRDRVHGRPGADRRAAGRGLGVASSLAYGARRSRPSPVHHLEGHLLAPHARGASRPSSRSSRCSYRAAIRSSSRSRGSVATASRRDARRRGGRGLRQGRTAARAAVSGRTSSSRALAETRRSRTLRTAAADEEPGARLQLQRAQDRGLARDRRARGPRTELDPTTRADIAASFQAAVVDTLAGKCRRALEATGLERLVIAGGVGANKLLRASLATLGKANRRPRVLSAARALHGQRRDDRVRRLVSAYSGRERLAAADHRAAPLAARRARAGRANEAVRKDERGQAVSARA